MRGKLSEFPWGLLVALLVFAGAISVWHHHVSEYRACMAGDMAACKSCSVWATQFGVACNLRMVK